MTITRIGGRRLFIINNIIYKYIYLYIYLYIILFIYNIFLLGTALSKYDFINCHL